MNGMVTEKQADVEGLCGKYGVARLEIFGSASGEGFDSRASDLDFLVEFNRMDTMNLADQYFGLLADLEKLFERRIDLVMARAMRNPYFIKSVERSRRTLFAA